jgi:predicted aminopeptidase
MGQRCSSWHLFLVLAPLSLFLNSCLFTYLVKSGTDQLKLLNARRPIQEVLADPNVNDETKRKLRLAMDARSYAETHLGFKPTKNYTSFVHLERPYVSWIVSVAHRDQLEYENFSYPLVGKMPYKGFFKEVDAQNESKKFPAEKYDTWVRGVTAYSTLGWFEDPILSTMLNGQDHDIIEVILHESAHATLFIESAADFNEQLATFLGQEGTRRYLQKQSGPNAPGIQQMEMEQHDQRVFSEFLTREIKDLREWYKAQVPPLSDERRQSRFKEIQDKFNGEVSKKFKTKQYEYFGRIKLNNAILLGLGTYMNDLSQFAQLLKKFNGDMGKFIQFCGTLKTKKNPSQSLKEALSEVTSQSEPRGPRAESPSSLSQ